MKEYIAYHNASSEALLQKVEITPAVRGGNFVFFTAHRKAYLQNLTDLLKENLPDLQILTQTAIDGQSVIIARTNDSPELLMAQLQQKSGDRLIEQPEKYEKKSVDLIRLRGHLGILSQLLMIGSAFFDSDKRSQSVGEGKKNYYQTAAGRSKIQTSVVSIFGFGLNSIYGVQKEMDHTRLAYAKNVINKNIALRASDYESNLPAPASTEKIESTLAKKTQKPNWMERNSIRFSSAIKILSKITLLQLDKKKDEKRDDSLFMSGALSIAGDLVSVTGLPEDPFQLDKKQDPISRSRRNSNFVSSMFDWASTFSLVYGSLNQRKPEEDRTEKKWYRIFDFENHERRGREDIQWWQLAASLTFVVNLIIKAMAPFATRKLDVDNFTAHTSLAIASTIKADHVHETAEITAQMMLMRELPEIHKQGFAKTFTNIANQLEQEHHIALSPSRMPQSGSMLSATVAAERFDEKHMPEKEIETPPATIAAEAVSDTAAEPEQAKEATSRPSPASRIASTPRPESISERVSNATASASLSPSAGV